MNQPDHDDFADYNRKGVPLYSPEIFVLLVLVIAGIFLIAMLVSWLG